MNARDKFEAAQAALNAAEKTYPVIAIDILKEALQSIVGIKAIDFEISDTNLHVILITKLGEAYLKDKQFDKAKQEFLNALWLVEKRKTEIYKENILPIFKHLLAIPNDENSSSYDNISGAGLYSLAINFFGYSIEHNVRPSTANEIDEQYNAIKQMTTNYYIKNLALQVYKILQFYYPLYFNQPLEKQLLADEITLPYEPPASIFYKQNKAIETTQLAQLKNEVAQLRQEVAKLTEARQTITPRASSPRFGFAGN